MSTDRLHAFMLLQQIYVLYIIMVKITLVNNKYFLVQVARVLSSDATFLDQQSYRVDLSPGYDHAFILSVVIIMHESLRRRRRRR